MKKIGSTIYLSAVLFLLYFPILILAFYSFTTSANIGTVHGFSLDNYWTLIENEELRAMIGGTLLLAFGSAFLATVLGSLGAIGAFYGKSWYKAGIAALNEVPVVNADVVTGFSVCILLIVVFGMDKESFFPLIVGHVILSAPFVYLSVLPKLKQMDESLYEAALDLGADAKTAFVKVVIPQIFPGILSGFTLAITLSLDDYFIASYTKPATFNTISTYVVNATKGSQTEIKTALWALSTVIFMVVILVVLLMNVTSKSKLKQTGKVNYIIVFVVTCTLATIGLSAETFAKPVTLRVCNWEEYIDLGDWDEEERIELDNGVSILGKEAMFDDFEKWYLDTYGQEVHVEYSCFGTNEDLYNQLTMGDTYDLVCPSDYMIMKLMAEDQLTPFSDEFYDREFALNYYAKGVSPYIRKVFDDNKINDEPWSKYAAGYMWGITGVLYNPLYMTEEEASTWTVFENPKFRRRITLKDNVRDTYFAVLGIEKKDLLTSQEFLDDPNYEKRVVEEMNDVAPDTIYAVQERLQDIMGNIYALETDSGKADMVTGKIVGNYQWSGDAVYAMDQADEDGVTLKFAVPRECTNLWFDGWVMLKKGIGDDAQKQQAAEAFVNYVSMPENVVRNMYYIGYTSCIAGEEGDDTVFQYLNWCYSAEDDEETVAYPLGYFFSGDNTDENYVVTASAEQIGRQLTSQYPSQETIKRTAVMGYYPDDANKDINQMWINVRCFDVRDIPVWVWISGILFVLFIIFLQLRKRNI